MGRAHFDLSQSVFKSLSQSPQKSVNSLLISVIVNDVDGVVGELSSATRL